MYSFECVETCLPDGIKDAWPKIRTREEMMETMKDAGTENNVACIAGRILPGAAYSHEMYGERFYRADILACRSSGIMDTIPLMVSENVVDLEREHLDGMVEVTGPFRSYNRKEDGKSHLELSVLVQGIRYLDDGYVDCGSNNRVLLKGFLCKPPVYRRTPLGREVTDILLAVNRPYGKSDYIPCICWGRDAVLASRLDVGSAVNITGRIQSREYLKVYPGTESETRVAYEVSIRKLEMDGM